MSGATVSNAVQLAVAAAEPQISLSPPSPATLPASGGSVAFSATTNLPDGTTLNLLESADGVNFSPTGVTGVTSGGAWSGTYTVPPNTAPVSEIVYFELST